MIMNAAGLVNGEKTPGAESVRDTGQTLVEELIESERPDAGRLSAIVEEAKKSGEPVDQVLDGLERELTRWIAEHKAFILRNREAIVDALAALSKEVEIRPEHVIQVLKGFGIILDASQDLNVIGIAKRFVGILEGLKSKINTLDSKIASTGLSLSRNDGVRVMADLTEGDDIENPEMMKIAKRIFETLIAARQKSVVEFQVPRGLDPAAGRREQFHDLMAAVRDSIFVNSRAEVRIIANTSDEAGELRRVLGQMSNKTDRALMRPDQIIIVNRQERAGQIQTGTPATITETEELVRVLKKGGSALDARRSADGQLIPLARDHALANLFLGAQAALLRKRADGLTFYPEGLVRFTGTE